MPPIIAALPVILVTVAVGAAVSIGISYAIRALTPKPKDDRGDGGRTVMLRRSDEPHRWIYGRTVTTSRLR